MDFATILILVVGLILFGLSNRLNLFLTFASGEENKVTIQRYICKGE